LRDWGVSPQFLDYHLIALRHLMPCPSGVCARPSRNQFVPDSVHAPYPLRWIHKGRDGSRRRRRMSFGAGTDPIDAG